MEQKERDLSQNDGVASKLKLTKKISKPIKLSKDQLRRCYLSSKYPHRNNPIETESTKLVDVKLNIERERAILGCLNIVSVECSICFDVSVCTVSPPCSHLLCLQCYQWMISYNCEHNLKTVCPLCKRQMIDGAERSQIIDQYILLLYANIMTESQRESFNNRMLQFQKAVIKRRISSDIKQNSRIDIRVGNCWERGTVAKIQYDSQDKMLAVVSLETGRVHRVNAESYKIAKWRHFTKKDKSYPYQTFVSRLLQVMRYSAYLEDQKNDNAVLELPQGSSSANIIQRP